ncbi:MAG: type II toxin-antitoxin system VapC family toxin [Candidatus Bathyarchaeia archaeon]
MLDLLTFDSEAVLAFFFGEAGGDQVRDIFEKIENGEAEGYMNIVNLTEVHYVLSRISPKIAEEKQRFLRAFGIRVVPIEDNGLWREAALMKCKHSLSLADAFAVATAKNFKTKLVVGRDKEFNNLGVELLRIR